MTLAEQLARDAGRPEICLLVVNTNVNAIGFYQKRGYRTAASEVFVGCGAKIDATQWLLMRKPLGEPAV
jgi:ribosomal protein S18 acetylase RimI-like enzyme